MLLSICCEDDGGLVGGWDEDKCLDNNGKCGNYFVDKAGFTCIVFWKWFGLL